MKTPVFIMALAILSTGAVWAAEDPAITQIRKEYDSIRKALPSMTEEAMEPLQESTEGGEVKAYRDGSGNIRFIRMELSFESGKEIEEYYYQKGKLVFALYEEHRYNAPINMTPKLAKEIGGKPFDPKKTSITANRYYFSNGKMLRWLDRNKKSVPSKKKEFQDAEKSVLDGSKKVYGQFEGETAH